MARMSESVFFFSALLLIVLAVTFYFVLGKGAVNILDEQMLHREQVISRSGANFTSSFFAYLEKSLVTLSENSDINRFDKKTNLVLDNYMNLWNGTPVGAINLTDNFGNFRFLVNRERVVVEGFNVSDRDYFKWAITAKKNEVKVFAPIIARSGVTKGQFIVPVVLPVINDKGGFKGALVASVRLSELVETFISPLKILDQTKVYMAKEDGSIVQAEDPKLIGKNVLQILAGEPFIGAKVLGNKMKTVLSSHKEGKMVLALPSINDGVKFEKYLVAYSPIKLGEDWGYLALMTPQNDALIFLAPFYFRSAVVLLISYLAILIFGLRVAKTIGYKEGFKRHGKIHQEK